VYRADPQGDGSWQVTRSTFDMTKPNGIALSADEQTLYVAQSDFDEHRLRELRAYPIRNGQLGPYTTLHTFGKDHRNVHRGIDGMRIDTEGNIVAMAGWHKSGPGPLLYVFDPQGRVLATRPVPTQEGPSNCAFGGHDLRTLYVTTVDGYLLAATTDVAGLPLWPMQRV
jgi:gluconolactonase